MDSPTITFSSPIDGSNLNIGDDLKVEIVTSNNSHITNMRLFLNNQFVRQENHAPYEWGLSSQNDAILKNLPEGNHQLKAVVTTSNGTIIEETIAVSVIGSTPTPPNSLTNIAPDGTATQSSTSHNGVSTLTTLIYYNN